jgi:NADH-ubiquinone oxidoreductase chain 2
MLIHSLIFLLLSNAITSRRDKSILYSRVSISILLISALISYDNLSLLFLAKGIGIFGGLFHVTATTNTFHIFIFLITSVILLLTSFYPRKVWSKHNTSPNKIIFTKLIYYGTLITNKMGEQFKIIEYALIILFIVTGSVFLISTSDLVSIFLSIELQSYGLYLLSTIYRDSEPATSGGLMYFLLGGLSSCFILLSTALLYANSGTTNLDSLYIITSISNENNENLTGLLYWYKPYYIHISLLFMGVGFLFKVSAAPFHF